MSPNAPVGSRRRTGVEETGPVAKPLVPGADRSAPYPQLRRLACCRHDPAGLRLPQEIALRPGLPMRAVRCVSRAVGQADIPRHAARRLPGTGKDCAVSRMAAPPASGACGAWLAPTPAHASAGPSDACQRSCKLLRQSGLTVEKSCILVDLFRFLETRSPQSVARIHSEVYEACLSQSMKHKLSLWLRFSPSFWT
jgi:hypothetical protein